MSREVIKAWLVGETDDCIIAEQDGVWIVADALTSQQWIDLFLEPRAIPERREEIAYILSLRFFDHFEPEPTYSKLMTEDEKNAEWSLLSKFILANWQAFYGTAQVHALGGDFDEVLIPFLREHLGDAVPERQYQIQQNGKVRIWNILTFVFMGLLLAAIVAVVTVASSEMPRHEIVIKIISLCLITAVMWVLVRLFINR